MDSTYAVKRTAEGKEGCQRCGGERAGWGVGGAGGGATACVEGTGTATSVQSQQWQFKAAVPVRHQEENISVLVKAELLNQQKAAVSIVTILRQSDTNVNTDASAQPQEPGGDAQKSIRRAAGCKQVSTHSPSGTDAEEEAAGERAEAFRHRWRTLDRWGETQMHKTKAIQRPGQGSPTSLKWVQL